MPSSRAGSTSAGRRTSSDSSTSVRRCWSCTFSPNAAADSVDLQLALAKVAAELRGAPDQRQGLALARSMLQALLRKDQALQSMQG